MYVIKPMNPAATDIFIEEFRISLPPNSPNRFLKKCIKTITLNKAERDVANANPPCLSGPIRSKLSIMLRIIEEIPILAGVLVSWRE